jgi:hypothetical protein
MAIHRSKLYANLRRSTDKFHRKLKNTNALQVDADLLSRRLLNSAADQPRVKRRGKLLTILLVPFPRAKCVIAARWRSFAFCALASISRKNHISSTVARQEWELRQCGLC